MKGGYIEFSVFLGCLTFILKFYASLIALSGVLAHLFAFALTSCGVFALIYRFRVQKPNFSTVRNFFGSDWGAYSSTSEDKPSDSEFVMKVIAHRACGLDAPENSLSALDKAAKAGITTVEFDVLLTADEVPVVFHDTTLLRMTDVSRNLEETPFEEIMELDISLKHPFGKNFKNERIPTLNEYIKFCLDNQIRMFIDLKGRKKKIVQVINDLFKQYPKLYEMAVVSSFNPVLIYKIRANDPKILCSLAWRPYFYSHKEFTQTMGPRKPRTNNLFKLFYLRILNHVHQWALWKFGFYILGLSALLLHKNMVTREVINYWNKRGVRVIAWSVNLPTEKQYFEKIMEVTYLTDTVINS